MSEELQEKWVSLSAATTGTGTAKDFGGRMRQVVAVLVPSGTVSGGTVIVEESAGTGDSGTWSQIAAFSTPATNTVQAIHATGCFLAVRAHITSNITGGGSVTVTIAGC